MNMTGKFKLFRKKFCKISKRLKYFLTYQFNSIDWQF